jgi:hypothetical protein
VKKNDDKKFLNMVEMMMNMDYYLSYTWDLTRSIKSVSGFAYGETVPLWERCDERFFWNQFLSKKFIDVTRSNASINVECNLQSLGDLFCQ